MAMAAIGADCPRCGGFLTREMAEEDEELVCLQCSWRRYSGVFKKNQGRFKPAGARVALRYMGDSFNLAKREALAFLTSRKIGDFTASTGGDHGLRYMVRCPFCFQAGDDELMIRRGKSSTHTWRCVHGHAITVLRTEKRELIGWR